MMYDLCTGQIIGSYAVRYDTLVNLINTEYSGSDATTVNIFIDLTCILNNLDNGIIRDLNPYNITACIINLCAHYRNFFNNFYHTHTRFFIIPSNVSLKNGLNNKFEPNYYRKYLSRNMEFHDLINDSLQLLNLLCQYIDDFYYAYTNREFGVFVMDILHQESDKYPSIIISKDPYIYQLVSLGFYDIRILRPYKKDGDSSYFINKDNAIMAMMKARKQAPIDNNIDSSLLSLIYAMTRVPERNLPHIHRLDSAIKALNKAITGGYIMNQRTMDVQYVIDTLRANKFLNINDPSKIIIRFKAIDILMQFHAYNTSEYRGIINLSDPDAVKKISAKYFKEYPLDLNVL